MVVNEESSPPLVSAGLYVAFSLLYLSFPYRLYVEYKTNKISFKVEKKLDIPMTGGGGMMVQQQPPVMMVQQQPQMMMQQPQMMQQQAPPIVVIQ